MSQIEQRLKELGYELPECPAPMAAYVPAVLINGFVYVSGQTPLVDGVLKYKGKVGIDVSEEQAYESARICALRMIAALKFAVGDLDRVERIVKVTGFVNSTGDFGNQPKVINGASEFLEKVFGEKGKHARSAVGTSSLPMDTPVEVEMIAAVK